MEKITSLSQLDPNGIYTYADYLTWQFEQTVELIKGKILPMAAPSRRHQAISRELNGVFYNYFKKHQCEFFAAPFDVRLFDKVKTAKANKDVYTVIQPDICIICDLNKLDEKGCKGAPDLIIEILSPGNSKKEMRIKKRLYEENLVKEYWIIDFDHEQTFQFILDEQQGVYQPPVICVSDEVLECALFSDLKIDLEELFKS